MLPAKNSQNHDTSNSKFTTCTKDSKPNKNDKENCNHNELWIDSCKCETTDNKKNKKKNSYECDNNYLASGDFTSKKESGSSSDHSHDCGYSSENNNGCCETGSLISSLSSSPEGSEMACSDGCCQPESDCIPHNRLSFGNGQQLSLQEMLEVSLIKCYIER